MRHDQALIANTEIVWNDSHPFKVFNWIDSAVCVCVCVCVCVFKVGFS